MESDDSLDSDSLGFDFCGIDDLMNTASSRRSDGTSQRESSNFSMDMEDFEFSEIDGLVSSEAVPITASEYKATMGPNESALSAGKMSLMASMTSVNAQALSLNPCDFMRVNSQTSCAAAFTPSSFRAANAPVKLSLTTHSTDPPPTSPVSSVVNCWDDNESAQVSKERKTAAAHSSDAEAQKSVRSPVKSSLEARRVDLDLPSASPIISVRSNGKCCEDSDFAEVSGERKSTVADRSDAQAHESVRSAVKSSLEAHRASPSASPVITVTSVEKCCEDNDFAEGSEERRSTAAHSRQAKPISASRPSRPTSAYMLHSRSTTIDDRDRHKPRAMITSKIRPKMLDDRYRFTRPTKIDERYRQKFEGTRTSLIRPTSPDFDEDEDKVCIYQSLHKKERDLYKRVRLGVDVGS